MSIPNIPTDNLYKFICLSGLALFLLISYYEVKSINESVAGRIEIEFRKIRLLEDSVLIIKETNKYEKRMAAFKKWNGTHGKDYTVDSLIWFMSESLSENGLVLFKEYLLDNKQIKNPAEIDRIISISLMETLSSIQNKEDRLDSISREIKSADLELNLRDQVKNKINNILGFFIAASLLVFYIGAYLWYKRRQKYEDMIIVQQANDGKDKQL